MIDWANDADFDLVDVRTPRGKSARLAARKGTSDLATIGSSFAGVAGSGLVDEYHLASLHITGTFLDVGGHIGSVTVAVLLDNPEARAVIVEPLPENVDMIRANLALNGLTERADIIGGAVGGGSVRYGDDVHRFIGNIRGANGPEVTSDAVVIHGDFAAIKTDCEGGEWDLFPQPDVQRCPFIFGEWHDGSPELVAMALPRHVVSVIKDEGGTGLFEAVAA